jgi:hypothetical protein
MQTLGSEAGSTTTITSSTTTSSSSCNCSQRTLGLKAPVAVLVALQQHH